MSVVVGKRALKAEVNVLLVLAAQSCVII